MNCKACQRLILSSERLDLPPAEASAHLAECPACHKWHHRVRQIESNVSLLPVPGSTMRDPFVQSLVDGAPLVTLNYEPPASRRPWRVAAAGVAAAIALVACSALLFNLLRRAPENPPLALNPPVDEPLRPPTTLAGKILELDLRLAGGESPRQRVETLAALADNLHGESRAIAQIAGPKELDGLATLYRKVVKEGIVARARKIPAGERREALDPIAGRLAVATREAEELAQKTPGAAQGLLLIAAAARRGDRDLRDIMKEATP